MFKTVMLIHKEDQEDSFKSIFNISKLVSFFFCLEFYYFYHYLLMLLNKKCNKLIMLFHVHPLLNTGVPPTFFFLCHNLSFVTTSFPVADIVFNQYHVNHL